MTYCDILLRHDKKARKRQFSNFIGQNLSMKNSDLQVDTSVLKAEIDRLVYELYGLTEDEIAIINKEE